MFVFQALSKNVLAWKLAGTGSRAPVVANWPIMSVPIWLTSGGWCPAIAVWSFATASPQSTGVTLTVTPVDWGQAVAKLQTAIAGHQTPDVSQMGTDMMGQFAATGALEAVPANFEPGTFFESAWNTNIVNGTVYGVPWYVETRLLYYLSLIHI